MDNLQPFRLGSPRVELDGGPVEIKRRQALTLLMCLAASDQPRCCNTLATAGTYYHPLKAAAE